MEVHDPGYKIESVPANQPDEYVRCPYFPEHELRRSRLPYHLMKCQKNPNAPQLVACPYNYMHRVHPSQKNDHLILCEDRQKVKFVDNKELRGSYQTTKRLLEKKTSVSRGHTTNAEQQANPGANVIENEPEEEMW